MVISSMPKPTGENRPPSGGGIPIRKERYLHRFDRSQTALLVVRTIQAATGERFTKTVREPWRGL